MISKIYNLVYDIYDYDAVMDGFYSNKYLFYIDKKIKKPEIKNFFRLSTTFQIAKINTVSKAHTSNLKSVLIQFSPLPYEIVSKKKILLDRPVSLYKKPKVKKSKSTKKRKGFFGFLLDTVEAVFNVFVKFVNFVIKFINSQVQRLINFIADLLEKLFGIKIPRPKKRINEEDVDDYTAFYPSGEINPNAINTRTPRKKQVNQIINKKLLYTIRTLKKIKNRFNKVNTENGKKSSNIYNTKMVLLEIQELINILNYITISNQSKNQIPINLNTAQNNGFVPFEIQEFLNKLKEPKLQSKAYTGQYTIEKHFRETVFPAIKEQLPITKDLFQLIKKWKTGQRKRLKLPQNSLKLQNVEKMLPQQLHKSPDNIKKFWLTIVPLRKPNSEKQENPENERKNKIQYLMKTTTGPALRPLKNLFLLMKKKEEEKITFRNFFSKVMEFFFKKEIPFSEQLWDFIEKMITLAGLSTLKSGQRITGFPKLKITDTPLASLFSVFPPLETDMFQFDEQQFNQKFIDGNNSSIVFNKTLISKSQSPFFQNNPTSELNLAQIKKRPLTNKNSEHGKLDTQNKSRQTSPTEVNSDQEITSRITKAKFKVLARQVKVNKFNQKIKKLVKMTAAKIKKQSLNQSNSTISKNYYVSKKVPSRRVNSKKSN